MQIDFGSMNVGRGTMDLSAGNVSGEATQVSQETSKGSSGLTIGTRTEALASSEPVADVSEAALSRDDDLGRLVNSAFSLPAPPMPSFT